MPTTLTSSCFAATSSGSGRTSMSLTTSMIAPHSIAPSSDRVAIVSIGLTRFPHGFRDVQRYRHRSPTPLIDERRVSSWDVWNRPEHEREVFDRALIHIELLVVEHARCIGPASRRLLRSWTWTCT